MKKLVSCLGIVLFLASCDRKTPEEYGKVTNSPVYYHNAVDKLTDVIIHDIFSPPVASRIYSYATLAGYEAMVPADERFQSMEGQFRDFSGVPRPADGEEYCFPLASLKAFMIIARNQTFTVDK